MGWGVWRLSIWQYLIHLVVKTNQSNYLPISGYFFSLSVKYTVKNFEFPILALFCHNLSWNFMVCTNHYLNQWWLIANRTPQNRLQWNLNQNMIIFTYEIIFFKMLSAKCWTSHSVLKCANQMTINDGCIIYFIEALWCMYAKNYCHFGLALIC